MGEAQRARLTENMRLAERLGAETVSLSGDDVADEMLELRAVPEGHPHSHRQVPREPLAQPDPAEHRRTVAGEER